MDFELDSNNVCTKLILSGFQETQSTSNEGDYNDYGLVANNLDDFKTVIREAVREHYDNHGIIDPDDYDDDCWDDDGNWYLRVSNQAVVEATTTSLQPVAEGFLKQLGFTQSGPYSSDKYPTSKVSVWTIGAKEFLAAIDWKGE